MFQLLASTIHRQGWMVCSVAQAMGSVLSTFPGLLLGNAVYIYLNRDIYVILNKAHYLLHIYVYIYIYIHT